MSSMPSSDIKVSVTPAAFAQLNKILNAKKITKALRVSVLGGGCSGFQYEFKLDESAEDDLILEDEQGTRVVIDPVSLPFLQDAQIDYIAELIGARFAVQNPNAQSTCGCGTSFSI